MRLCLIPADVTIRLEQELYTVAEGEGPVTVCAQIIDGNLRRPVIFTLSTFQGPGTAIGESCNLFSLGMCNLTSQTI